MILVFLIISRNLLIQVNLAKIVILVIMGILIVLVILLDWDILVIHRNLIIFSDYSDSGNSRKSG